MKLSFISIFWLGILIDNVNSQKCSKISVRKEVRSLSQNEWKIYVSTMKEMHRLGWLNRFAIIHSKYFRDVHGTKEFLPWHRRFLVEFENTARSINPSYVQPYWDSSIDFKNPASSKVLSSSMIGGNGKGDDMCVGDGLQKGWINEYPERRCLRRNYNNKDSLKPFISPESVSSDIQLSSTFKEFSSRIESGVHNQVHSSVGGDMGQGQSPLDLLFMLHHANIDRIWWIYQNAKKSNMLSYSGNLDEKITFYNYEISTLMKLGEGYLCYSYTRSPVLNRRQDGFSTNKTDIYSVLQVPEMSLATGVSKNNLERFFPDLISGNPSPNSIDMPNTVSQGALDYIKSRKNLVNNKSGINNSTNSVGTNEATASIQNSLISDLNSDNYGNPNIKNISNRPKMPYPEMVSDEMAKHHLLDLDFYHSYYEEKRALVDALNADGYVSPYI
ncbi:Tyrosinase [Smittium mucronatum]|uniref:Tyrosinase n=1 Tax=Smittium mucronatum TaxID=133383 RepID=A0A1R0GZJ6_9FUNG|nr:Tyrosinase [Smittium mucronatum]